MSTHDQTVPCPLCRGHVEPRPHWRYYSATGARRLAGTCPRCGEWLGWLVPTLERERRADEADLSVIERRLSNVPVQPVRL